MEGGHWHIHCQCLRVGFAHCVRRSQESELLAKGGWFLFSHGATDRNEGLQKPRESKVTEHDSLVLIGESAACCILEDFANRERCLRFLREEVMRPRRTYKTLGSDARKMNHMPEQPDS